MTLVYIWRHRSEILISLCNYMVYYKYTTLTLLKTAKLLFLKGKRVKYWRFHTAGVAGSNPASPTKNSRMKSST